MSYTNEQNCLHLLTSVAFGGTTIKGAKGVRVIKDVRRNPIRADGNKGPTARPVQEVDASCVIRFLDGNGIQAETATSATLTSNYATPAGGTGSVAMSTMLPSGWDLEAENPEGGFVFQQTYEVVGATITINITQ